MTFSDLNFHIKIMYLCLFSVLYVMITVLHLNTKPHSLTFDMIWLLDQSQQKIFATLIHPQFWVLTNIFFALVNETLITQDNDFSPDVFDTHFRCPLKSPLLFKTLQLLRIS